jgi:hypothetical protein
MVIYSVHLNFLHLVRLSGSVMPMSLRSLLSIMMFVFASFAVLSSAQVSVVSETITGTQAAVEGFSVERMSHLNETIGSAAHDTPLMVSNATIDGFVEEAALLKKLATITGQSLTCYQRHTGHPEQDPTKTAGENCSPGHVTRKETKDVISLHAAEMDVETLIKLIGRVEKDVSVTVNKLNISAREDREAWVVNIQEGHKFSLHANVINFAGSLVVNADGRDRQDYFHPDPIAPQGRGNAGKGGDGKVGHPGGPGGKIIFHVVRVVAEDPSAGLKLSARGGRGGRGQIGGRGAHGQDGAHGEDVTWCSAEKGPIIGGAGGNGTAGGEGGAEGPGGVGGQGGVIDLTVIAPHQIFIHTDVSPGHAGPNGLAGSGGEGGAAGRGGHGCHRACDLPNSLDCPVTYTGLDGPSGQRGPNGKKGASTIATSYREGTVKSSTGGGFCPQESFVSVARAISAANGRLQQRDHVGATALLADTLVVAEACAAKNAAAWGPVISEVQGMMAVQQEIAAIATNGAATNA